MPIERSGGGGSAAASVVSLQYDFTVTGAAKASIDTNVDGANAGLFPTTGKMLLIVTVGRTDEAAFISSINLTVNNDAGANYNRAFIATSGGGTPTQGTSIAANNWVIGMPGASGATNTAAAFRMEMPAYADTTLFKVATEFAGNAQNATAGQYQAVVQAFQYNATTAITRFAMTPTTAGAKFVIGTRLTVYIYS